VPLSATLPPVTSPSSSPTKHGEAVSLGNGFPKLFRFLLAHLALHIFQLLGDQGVLLFHAQLARGRAIALPRALGRHVRGAHALLGFALRLGAPGLRAADTVARTPSLHLPLDERDLAHGRADVATVHGPGRLPAHVRGVVRATVPQHAVAHAR
jgi:hypothetical protein